MTPISEHWVLAGAMPEQCLIIGFDGPIAFTDRFLHGLNIDNLNSTPRIFYSPRLLKGARMQRDTGSLYTQHLGKEFLGELQIIGVGQVSRPEQPAAKPRFHVMSCHAGSRLACLRVHRLLVTNQR